MQEVTISDLEEERRGSGVGAEGSISITERGCNYVTTCCKELQQDRGKTGGQGDTQHSGHQSCNTDIAEKEVLIQKMHIGFLKDDTLGKEKNKYFTKRYSSTSNVR